MVALTPNAADEARNDTLYAEVLEGFGIDKPRATAAPVRLASGPDTLAPDASHDEVLFAEAMGPLYRREPKADTAPAPTPGGGR